MCAGRAERLDQVLAVGFVAQQLAAQVAATALRGRDRRKQAGADHPPMRVARAPRGTDQRPYQHLEHHQRAHRVAGEQERRYRIRAEPAEALHRTRMHGDARRVDPAEVGQRGVHLVAGGAPGAAGDHDQLRHEQPALDDLAQPLRVARRDADPADLGARVTRGGGQGVGVDVVGAPRAPRFAGAG